MFKRIKFEIKGAMGGGREVEIWTGDDNKLHYKKAGVDYGWFFVPSPEGISELSVDSFSRSLDLLNVSTWKKHYEPVGYMVLDGRHWALTYETTDGPAITKTGENAYPKNWEEFLAALEMVVGEF